jgi:hypothetical protein
MHSQLIMQILQCKNVHTEHVKHKNLNTASLFGDSQKMSPHAATVCDRLQPALYLNDKSKSVRLKDYVRTRYESKESVNVSIEVCSSYANSIRYTSPLCQSQDKENYYNPLTEIMIILLQFMYFLLRLPLRVISKILQNMPSVIKIPNTKFYQHNTKHTNDI